MHMKVPHCSGNSFIGCSGDSINDESSSDFDEMLELSSDDDINDFSDFLWMENEEEFEDQVFQNLEEEELINDCLEAMNEIVLLDEIKQVEAEHIIESSNNASDVAEKSNLNPYAKEFVPCSIVVIAN